jgi:tRNA threonylcarbamoyladenosine biosynthesis protein TsaE
VGSRVFVTKSSEETEKLAKRLAKNLKGGEVLALFGELGSGKTTFAKGLGKGLGARERIISPTFIIQNVHILKKDLRFYHFDLYRLDKVDPLTLESIKEAFSDKNGISAIEWADKIKEMFPAKTTKINFEYIDENTRRITING